MEMRKDAREVDRVILAHGEATGHCHEVVAAVGTCLAPAQFFEEPDGTRMLLVLEPCELRHEEHGVIALDPAKQEPYRQGDVYLHPKGPGTWQVIRQQEWPGPQGWRQVAD